MDAKALAQRIRYFLVFFVVALAASSLTAVPLVWEVNLLAALLVRRNGKTGEAFLACSRFPRCRHTEPLPS